MKKRWITAIKRKDFRPSTESRVCTDHFRLEDYATTDFDSGHTLIKRILKKDVVPSIFSWKRKLDISLQDARLMRQKQRELKLSQKRLMVTSSNCNSCPTVETNTAFIEPVLLSSSEDINHYSLNKISIGCEIEVTDSTCNANTSQITTEKTVSLKVNTGSSKKTFANAATQTFMKITFTIENLRNNSKSVSYYTGFESLEKLKLVLHSLGPSAYELTYRYGNVVNVAVEDQFLITLIKLRRAISDIGLALMFDVSKTTIQNIVITWLNFMYCEWSEIDIWPNKDLIMYYMPSGFKQMYPSTRVILDGTEFPINAPKNPKFQQATFSTYKNKTTLKVLVSATPGGLISYISSAYAGSVSDRAIVERSNLT
ncbi:PREDICTED: uncharacterized protein LOC108770301 [Trachymyrmex cornetzi]|nr:PREDICTED: uncharacterized protein LOC108770301 [Trachymyrmex cornetzi]